MDASTPVLFEGVWNVDHATLPNGAFAYTGRIAINQRGAAFDLEWDISAGAYVGVGLQHAGRLYVSCGEQRAGLGLLLLARGPETVDVRWATPELDGVGSGRLELTAASFEGKHALALVLPDGRPYGDWSLAIHRSGAIYALEWRKGAGVHFRGLGLETPAGLAAGWYPDTAQLAFLEYESADERTLRARWALGGFTTLGAETLTRIGAPQPLPN
jgi:hypothetical protein